MSGIDASALKGLANKGRSRLPPPPVDGNPQIGAKPLEQVLVNTPAQDVTAAMPPVAIVALPEAVPAAQPVPMPAIVAAPPACPLTGPHGAALAALVDKPVARRLDGRTLRRTGRVRQLGLKVTAEFDDGLRAIAAARGIMLAQALEDMMVVYLAQEPLAMISADDVERMR